MRWFVILLLAWAGSAAAQNESPSRLEIELVPVVVFNESTLLLLNQEEQAALVAQMLTTNLVGKIPEALAKIHRATAILGIRPHAYNLSLSDRIESLLCSPPNFLTELSCLHSKLGRLNDVKTFVRDLYPDVEENGKVQIHVMFLPEKFYWPNSTVGIAGTYLLVDENLRHWTNSSCRAWAINELPVIAHELGHCMGLKHNQDDYDSTGEIDLMLSGSSGYVDWLKDSNLTIIQHHFRPEAEVPPSSQNMQRESILLF